MDACHRAAKLFRLRGNRRGGSEDRMDALVSSVRPRRVTKQPHGKAAKQLPGYIDPLGVNHAGLTIGKGAHTKTTNLFIYL